MINVLQDFSLKKFIAHIKDNFTFLIAPTILGLLLGIYFSQAIPHNYKGSAFYQYSSIMSGGPILTKFQAGTMERVKIALRSPIPINSTLLNGCSDNPQVSDVNVLNKDIKIKITESPSNLGIYEIRFESQLNDVVKKCGLKIIEFIKSESESAKKAALESLQQKINVYEGAFRSPGQKNSSLVCGSNDLNCLYKQSEAMAILVSDGVNLKIVEQEVNDTHFNVLTPIILTQSSTYALKFLLSVVGFLMGLIIGLVMLFIKNGLLKK